MKKIIVLVCLLSCGYVLADGAFGVKGGMTKNELKEKGITLKKTDDSNVYASTTAPITNKHFQFYIYTFKANIGLCSISAITKDIVSDKKGTEIIKLTNTLKNELENKYGESFFIDKIGKENSNQWMSIMLNRSSKQSYIFFWNKKNQLENNNNINMITLMPIVLTKDKGVVRVTYYLLDDGCFEDSGQGL